MSKASFNKEVMGSELKLGDVVRGIDTDNSPFSTAIVKQIRDGRIHFYRPYGVTADFSYTGGVICYTGLEEWTISDDSEVVYFVYERQELK